mmetsp:Transcript_7345/g.12175  ORF Transcript_7345/g.12175 Transcript_7345/m.12175 type:complete len:234 (+) Transcript_7345:100-801(+)
MPFVEKRQRNNVSRGRGCGINPSWQSVHHWTLCMCIPPANHSQPRPARLHPLSSECALPARVLSHLHQLRLSWRAASHRLQYDEHGGHWVAAGETIWDTSASVYGLPWHVPYLVDVHPCCVSPELGMSIRQTRVSAQRWFLRCAISAVSSGGKSQPQLHKISLWDGPSAGLFVSVGSLGGIANIHAKYIFRWSSFGDICGHTPALWCIGCLGFAIRRVFASDGRLAISAANSS